MFTWQLSNPKSLYLCNPSFFTFSLRINESWLDWEECISTIMTLLTKSFFCDTSSTPLGVSISQRRHMGQSNVNKIWQSAPSRVLGGSWQRVLRGGITAWISAKLSVISEVPISVPNSSHRQQPMAISDETQTGRGRVDPFYGALSFFSAAD